MTPTCESGISITIAERGELLTRRKGGGTTSSGLSVAAGALLLGAMATALLALLAYRRVVSDVVVTSVFAVAMCLGLCIVAAASQVKCGLCRDNATACGKGSVPQWCRICGSLMKNIPRSAYLEEGAIDVEELLCAADGVLQGLGTILKDGMEVGSCWIEFGREGFADVTIAKGSDCCWENIRPMPTGLCEQMILAFNSLVFESVMTDSIATGYCNVACGGNKWHAAVEIADDRNGDGGRLRMAIKLSIVNAGGSAEQGAVH